jgi:hypothetical protein
MPVTNVEFGFMEISFIAEANRMYKVTNFAEVEADAVDSQLSWIIRRTYDGTRPNLSSPSLNAEIFYGGTFTGFNSAHSFTFLSTFPPGPVRLLWSLGGNACKQTIWSSTGPSQFWVEDMGDTSLFDNIAVVNDGSGTGSETDEDTTGIVKTYDATWSRSYSGYFDLRSSYAVNDRMYQGYYDDSFANQRSIIGFDYSTIKADLTDATIKKVELFLYASHWYWDYGTGWIGTHDWLSAPSNWDGSRADTRRVSSSSWNRATGRWVDIGTTIGEEFVTDVTRGIVIGPAPDFDHLYYGHFVGANGSVNAPKLRITYTK